MKQPVRVKLTKGETFVGVSYDNQNRRFTGTIETDKGYGEAFSLASGLVWRLSAGLNALVTVRSTNAQTWRTAPSMTRKENITAVSYTHLGLTRVVTKVQTNGFYSKIKDQSDHKWST